MKVVLAFVCCLISLVSVSQIEEYNKVRVVDSSQYDNKFIEYWGYPRAPVLIVKDSVIVNNEKNYPIIIPTDLPLNKTLKYKSVHGDSVFELFVSRINYTKLIYEVIVRCNNRHKLIRKGYASLEPSFHLGNEGLYQKGEQYYPMNDYNDIRVSENEGYISLLIPVGTIEAIDFIESIKKSKYSIRFINPVVNNK